MMPLRRLFESRGEKLVFIMYLIFLIVFSVRTIRGREFAPEVTPLPAGVSTHEVYPTNCSSSLSDPGQLNRSGTLKIC